MIWHFGADVLPYIYCCKGPFSDCNGYYEHRPSGKAEPLPPPPPGEDIGVVMYLVNFLLS